MLSTTQAIDLAEESAGRFVTAVGRLGEEELRAPALLPGWTRADGIAHVAQALGAYVRIVSGVSGSERITAAYRRPVEDTAALPGPDLVRELREGAEEFVALARSLSAGQWKREVTSAGGWQHTAHYTLLRCLRELETHHTDLGIGYGHDNWPLPYAHWALDDTLTTLRTREFPVAAVQATDLSVRWKVAPHGPEATGPSRLLLAWLAGRAPARELGPDPLPSPPPWPQPPAQV
ncbi:maleylpyruvate isomerase family mycothiol-dependent enzyme [Streptomyces sp. TRM66268-LWL]|uniref:Maleylpyruvate isomerase family mycothiol-dependent enzyme n=1 Tax=Streptomyces polyasparticus TaxID=2767826 RepID=A0ABR7SK59_9ACTN|nr:maleylpyruvate isomerase family mycothiol-dependent enzyme [Streptomyces polyasparticus]MBC9715090.1 maleylpyruvate isomerase family mycothiol-dependent enzyme [Streptomyces polyasparticus]